MKKFNCIYCSYETNDYSNYKKHIQTSKHISNEKINNLTEKSSNIIQKNNDSISTHTSTKNNKIKRECLYCKNILSSRQALWVHLKTCKSNNQNINLTNVVVAMENINKNLLIQNKIITELLDINDLK